MQKAFLISTLMIAAALAGCAEEPPAGTFTATAPAAFAESATATLEVTPASNDYPVNDPSGADSECQLDEVTGQDPSGSAPTCEPAHSAVTGHFASLKAPSMSWSVWLAGAEGDFKLGDLVETEAGSTHYDLAGDFPGEDLSGYDSMELRDGDVAIARAGGMGGTFELAEELDALSAAVEFAGKDITVSLTDAPNGTMLVAWLVGEDAETGELVHEESFTLSGDETTYTATKNIGDFVEFHVHVGNSKVNVAVATIA